jgi:hypothetical protein
LLYRGGDKVKPQTTLIIVAVFALLAGYVYFFELNKTPEQISATLGTPTAKPPTYVIQVDALNIKSVEIADLRAPREVKLSRTETSWQLLKPVDKPADRFSVESAVAGLASLKASRVLTEVANLGQYGLITPTLEARIVMRDDQQYAITVGGKTADARNYYATYTGDNTRVFLIEASRIDAVKVWLDLPPYEPTPVPTLTPAPTPVETETPAATETPKP